MVALSGVGERETVLVGDPFLVDFRIIAGETTHHFAAAVIDTDRRAGGVVLGDRRRRNEIKWSRSETVVGAGQRSDRADLDRIAREVGGERLLLVNAYLLVGTTF